MSNLSNVKNFIGVDISKDTLDICVLNYKLAKQSKANLDQVDKANLDQGDKTNLEQTQSKEQKQFFKIPNNPNSIKAFFMNFNPNQTAVTFESTNNYGVNLAKTLSELKIPFQELNAYKSSLFLKHLSYIKTDITDSYGLAYYCANFSNIFIQSKFNPNFKLIKSYQTTLNMLSKMQTQMKNLEKSQIGVNDEYLKQAINSFKLTIKSLFTKLEDFTYEILSQEIPQTKEIIENNKGFGKSLAIAIFPIMQYNKDKNYKQIISFLGLSPRVFQSGTSVLKSPHIDKKGPSKARKALFLSALSCIRYNEYFKAKFDRLLANGKPKMVAIIAVMCQMIKYLKLRYFSDDLNNVDLKAVQGS